MLEEYTLARPYAKAAFAFAKEKNLQNNWLQMLSVVSFAMQDKKISDFIKNPTIEAKQKVDSLVGLLDKESTNEFKNFLQALSFNKRLLILPSIAYLFAKLKAESENVLATTIETAFALSKEQEQNLINALSKKFDSKIDLTVEINKDLIGGIIIRTNNQTFDYSVRGKLDKLTKSLQS